MQFEKGKYYGILASDDDETKAQKKAHNAEVTAGKTQQTTAAPAQQTQQTQTQPQTQPSSAPQSGVYNPRSNELYMGAIEALKNAQSNMPTYNNSYESELREVYDKIVNRDKFKYDLNSDALYNQYKDQYVNLGSLAMQDTMGQAAQLTGGYGNSYAASAGNQAYQAYLAKLNGVVPQLYGMARDQYNLEGQGLKDQYAMLGDMRDNEYRRYLDGLNNYWQNVSFLANERDKAYDQGYTANRDALAQQNYMAEFNYNAEQDRLDREYKDRVFDYQMGQDALAQKNYENEFNYKAGQDALDRDYKDRVFDYQQSQDALAQQNYLGELDYKHGQDSLDRQYQERLFAYQKERDAASDREKAEKERRAQYTDLIDRVIDSGYIPSDDELSSTGLTRDQINGILTEYGYPTSEDAFSGETYEEAQSYMRSYGVPSELSVGLMAKSEWAKRKKNGSSGAETSYASYAEYLAAYVEYALDQIGGGTK